MAPIRRLERTAPIQFLSTTPSQNSVIRQRQPRTINPGYLLAKQNPLKRPASTNHRVREPESVNPLVQAKKPSSAKDPNPTSIPVVQRFMFTIGMVNSASAAIRAVLGTE